MDYKQFVLEIEALIPLMNPTGVFLLFHYFYNALTTKYLVVSPDL